MDKKKLEEVGDRLRQYMNREDLAISVVAKELGLRSAQVHSMLQGKSYGLEYLLAFLARHPHLNTEWLIFGRGEMLMHEQFSKETLAIMRTKTRIPGVAERLSEYLEKKKMSPHMLAKRTNLTPSVVYNIVKGHTNYKTEYVFTILLQQQDINPSWLLTGKHREEKDPEKQRRKFAKEYFMNYKEELKALATKEEVQELKADLQEIKELLKAQSKK